MNKIKLAFRNINWKYTSTFLVLILIFFIIPTCIVIVNSFIPAPDATVADNWTFINGFYWEKILISIGVAIAVCLLVFAIGFPFGFFLSRTKSKTLRIVNIFLITAPLWVSTLIKVVGMKTLFDVMIGQPQGTYGYIYTIIALTYNSLPSFILLIYNVMILFPENLLRASKDLGRNNFDTFRYVVFPYTYEAVAAGLFLIFMSSLTTSGITAFMDNSNNGSLIGSVIFDIGKTATESQIALSRVSSLSLVLGFVLVLLFTLFIYLPKKINQKMKEKK